MDPVLLASTQRMMPERSRRAVRGLADMNAVSGHYAIETLGIRVGLDHISNTKIERRAKTSWTTPVTGADRGRVNGPSGPQLE